MFLQNLSPDITQLAFIKIPNHKKIKPNILIQSIAIKTEKTLFSLISRMELNLLGHSAQSPVLISDTISVSSEFLDFCLPCMKTSDIVLENYSLEAKHRKYARSELSQNTYEEKSSYGSPAQWY